MTSPRPQPCSTGRLAGVRGWIYSALAMSAGCASAPPSETEIAYARSMSPSVVLATTPTQEQALERAASLPVGEPTELAGGVVVSGPIYPAASGRRCRTMAFGSSQRLACEDAEAGIWVFVPDIFASGPSTAGAEEPSEPRTADPDAGSTGQEQEGSS